MTANTMTGPATGALMLERLARVKARTRLSRSEIYGALPPTRQHFPRP